MFWTIQDVCNHTTLSESSIRRLILSDGFPAPRNIMSRKKVWLPDEVRAWCMNQIKASKPKSTAGGLAKWF